MNNFAAERMPHAVMTWLIETGGHHYFIPKGSSVELNPETNPQ
jgi:hypothetical protein